MARVNLGPYFSEGARQVWIRLILKGVRFHDIERAIGLPKGMVHRYVWGDRRPSVEVVFALQDAYGIRARSWTEEPRKPFSVLENWRRAA